MKTFLGILVVMMFAAPAFADTAQQGKMKTCNADASKQDLKGDARKAFMKECLSAKKEMKEGKKTAQQEKMKTCNADAGSKNLKGAERKKFMSECLKAN